jgi:hypothetical protein
MRSADFLLVAYSESHTSVDCDPPAPSNQTVPVGIFTTLESANSSQVSISSAKMDTGQTANTD